MFLSVPIGVESRIVEFVSSGDEGLASVLTLRQVCKTTKSWVDNLPSRIASRVFSMSYVSLSSNQVTEDYVTKLTKFPPPVGLTTLHLKVYFGSDLEKFQTVFQQIVDFWCGRLESLSLKIIDFDPDSAEHNKVASTVSSFLERSTNLRKAQFFIRSLVDLCALNDFFLKRKSAEDIRIHLIFGERYHSRNLLLQFPETLCAILVSIFENQSIYKVDIIEDGLLYEIERAAGTAASVYINFLKIIKHLESNHITSNLKNHCLSLETLIYCSRSLLEMKDLQIPSTVKHLRLLPLRKNPLGSLPEFLTSFQVEEIACSRVEMIIFIVKIENECPNLIKLYVKWALGYPSNTTEQFIKRTGRSNGFTKLRSLSFVGKLFNPADFSNLRKESLTWGKCVASCAFPWNDMALKLLELDFKVEHTEEPLRVIDNEILSSILLGESGKTLLRVRIPNEIVASDGLDTLWSLQSSAIRNSKEREETVGRKILPEHPDFLADF